MSYFPKNKLPPIGSVTGWLKSLTNTPSLPAGFVECNGQTITDTKSPYYNTAVPDINNSGSIFLRGSATSGNTGGTTCHYHCVYYGVVSLCAGVQSWADCTVYLSVGYDFPSYYDVVYIIRIK